MSLTDDPFADLVKYDGACQICHGDMRKCDGKCGGMLDMPELTTDQNDPRLGYGSDNEPRPQQEVYLVLPEEERAKGFVRPVRRSYKHTTCGSVTTMGQTLAETYAREPKFYGSTYCVHCQMHKPVAEFTWVDDGTVVGS